MSTDTPRAANGAIFNLSTAFSRPENSRMLWRFCHALPCREAWRKPVIERRGGVAEGTPMSVYFHDEDLPEGVQAPGPVAIAPQTMGLNPLSDRVCLVTHTEYGRAAGRERGCQDGEETEGDA